MLAFDDIIVKSRNKCILQRIGGVCQPGTLTAILGPSGSGKTVLMKVLCGRERELHGTGRVCVNGQVVSIDSQQMTPNCAYVPQEDILLGDLTIRQALTVSASLRVNADASTIHAEVDRVMAQLGLAHRANTAVGTALRRGLSGGEKRRTSVGVELVARPAVLFLDEPTSGLDATAAFELIQTLHYLCHNSQGKTSCVLTIHQPNSRLLNLFDHLIMLVGGRAVYNGPTSQAASYFDALGYSIPAHTKTTPTDYYMQLVDNDGLQFNWGLQYFQSELGVSTQRQAKAICDQASSSSSTATTAKAVAVQQNATGFWRQCSTLLHRHALLGIRDPTLYLFQMLLILFFGLMTGFVFFQLSRQLSERINDVPNGMLWIALCCTYVFIFKSFFQVQTHARFLHEYANGSFSVGAYVAADIITALYWNFIVIFPSLVSAYFLEGLPKQAFGFVLLDIYFLALASEALLGLVAIFFNRVSTVIFVAQGTLVILCVFAFGSFIKWPLIPRGWVWLSEYSPYSPASRGFLTSVYKHRDFNCDLNRYGVNGSACTVPGFATFACQTVNGNDCLVSGPQINTILNDIAIDQNEFEYIGWLALHFVCYRLVSLFFHKYPPNVVWAMIMRAVSRIRSGGGNDDNSLLCSDMKAVSAPKAKEGAPNLHKHTMSVLSFEGITLRLNTTDKLLIDHVSACASSAQVLAIMGPSGAGKTTLLNALSNRAPYAKISGSVKLNGKPLSKNDLAFVPQFDALNPLLTPRETLTFTARLFSTASPAVLDVQVSSLLNALGLSEVADTRVGSSEDALGLSGGQRKRVSIGLGVVTGTPVLFLDEPTTGLDSSSAYGVVNYIRAIAVATQTVMVMTIHQPSAAIFSTLDELLLLAPPGQVVYFGPASRADGYFAQLGHPCPQSTNPADHFLDLVSAKNLARPDCPDWKSLYLSQSSPIPTTTTTAAVQSNSRPSSVSRYLLLVQRSMLYLLREKRVHWFRWVQLVCFALFIGSLFFRLSLTTSSLPRVASQLFFGVWSVLFASISGAPILVRDRFIFENEFLNGGYGLMTHTWSFLTASIPFVLVGSFIFESILTWMTGANDSGSAYIYSVIMIFALMLMMEGITLCVVQVFKEAMLSSSFCMIVLGCLFLMAGFFIKVPAMPAGIFWMAYLVPSKYAFDGMLFNTLHGQSYLDPSSGVFVTGDQLLDSLFEISPEHNHWGDIGIVLAYALGFRLILILQLWWSYRRFMTPASISTSTSSDTLKPHTSSLEVSEDEFIV